MESSPVSPETADLLALRRTRPANLVQSPVRTGGFLVPSLSRCAEFWPLSPGTSALLPVPGYLFCGLLQKRTAFRPELTDGTVAGNRLRPGTRVEDAHNSSIFPKTLKGVVIYGFVREKLQETRIAEESEIAYAELIEPAGVPRVPVSPDIRRNLILGMLLGFVGGSGLVFVREAFDTHVRAPEDLEELCDRVLGVIPSMNPLLEAEFDGDEVEIEGQSLRSTAVMLTAPQSSAAEAYRQLQVNLRYARPDASTRSLIVTSPERGDGKSTTSLNLAIAAARSGETVALVDADLRNPQLHCLLDVSSTPGLPEALYDDASFINPGVDNLPFLPSGDTCPNPSELLGSQHMDRFVTSLVEEVDLVVIDTPPALPFSDPTALMPHTDGALLVASANETDRRAFERAHSKLDSVGPRVLGGVLNRFDPESGTYGYYEYYDYYKYYDYAHGNEDGSEASWLTEVMPARGQRQLEVLIPAVHRSSTDV